ncbi:MAG: hypothetical protein ACLFVJ_22905 [Persicimonas sp.]
MRDRTPSPGLFRSKPSSAHRWGVLLLAGCVFASLMLAASSVGASKVLLAPNIDLEFDQLDVEGDDDGVRAGYELREVDWQWARDYSLDLWIGLYTPQSGGDWRLERATALDERGGEVEISEGISPDADRVGVCLVAATEGGQLAPGTGYICEDPVEITVEDGRIDLAVESAAVALRLEPNIDEASWFSPEFGFETTMASARARVDEDGEQQGFVVHEQPPARDTQAQREQTQQQGDGDQAPRIVIRMDRPPDDFRDYAGYDGYGYYQPFYFDPRFLPRSRFHGSVRGSIDRFRQRRLERRRIFGPLDPFDARFNQDMFTDHPEDVFYRFRIPPGHFGRDAFGRPLQQTAPAPQGPLPGDPAIDALPGNK